MSDVISTFKPGWLQRQLESASKQFVKWPKWKRELYEIKPSEPISDEEYRTLREDSQKYGNY